MKIGKLERIEWIGINILKLQEWLRIIYVGRRTALSCLERNYYVRKCSSYNYIGYM